MSRSNYIEYDRKNVEQLFDSDLILIVTATELETKYTHQRITPINGYKKIIRVYEGNHTYYFGMFGRYKVAHVECSMGSVSRDSSIMTISTALTLLKSKVVIMVGIAFGIDPEKQNIGDVLVAKSVIPYNVKRVGETKTINRGIEAQSSQILLNRFKSIIITWEHLLTHDIKAKLLFTRILSGEELVDNLEHRNKLIAEFPDSEGGEMEGVGLYSACGDKIDWILVKGICDFADGKKGINKKANQQIAVESALSACSEIFTSPSAFKDIGILPFINSMDSNLIDNINISEVLFDFYDSTKENYYVERESDKVFNQIITQYSVWIHGPSGSGKSNLIIRNLIKSKKPFIQINLGPCIGQNIESFFYEMLYEIASHVEGVSSQDQPKTFPECSKALISLLNKHFQNKELLIFIDEIPISSDRNQREFAEKIFALVISKNFVVGLNKVKFVLSSINNPTSHISLIQHKVHQQMHFQSLDYWTEEEITKLTDIIIKVFNLILTPEFKFELINSSHGSPRFIKKFFRSIYTLNKVDEKTLRSILKETERELSQLNNA
jgi:nucleoside phosphorylase